MPNVRMTEALKKASPLIENQGRIRSIPSLWRLKFAGLTAILAAVPAVAQHYLLCRVGTGLIAAELVIFNLLKKRNIT